MKKAFSLIELSIVILIIGILVAGVMQSSRLINAMRTATAQQLTKASPVASIKNLLFWYETSLENSLISSETEDGTAITIWNDINPQSTYKNNAYAGQRTNASGIGYNLATSGTSGNTSGPTYVQNGINNIPTLRFTNAATTYRYMVVDAGARNQTLADMTMFAVIHYRSGSGWIADRNCVNTSFVPTACGSSRNGGMPLFGAEISAGTLRFDARDTAGTVTSSGTYYFTTGSTLTTNRKYVLTNERIYGTAFRAYVNGVVTSTAVADNLGIMDLDPVKIGRHVDNNTDTLDVDISEIIMFSGKISNQDREDIEEYLGKKYDIDVN